MSSERAFLVASIAALDLPTLDVGAVRNGLPGVVAALEELAELPERLRGANDIEGALAQAFAFVQSAGDAAFKLACLADLLTTASKQAQRCAEQGRAAMGKAMLDIGAPPLQIGTFRVDALEPGQRVEVVEPERIPAAYWRTPAPEIDKAKIRRDLLHGSTVSGARLVSGSPAIRIIATRDAP